MSDERPTWTATWRGGFATEISGRGHRLRADEPTSVGGTDTGPMPTELLTASLASCFCMAVAFAAAKRGLEPGALSVDVTAHRAGTDLRYGRYEIVVHADLPDDALERLVASAKRYCWVTNTLAAPPEIVYRIGPGQERRDP